MSDHRFDPLTRYCVGCDISASEVADKSGLKRFGKLAHPGIEKCPAIYTATSEATGDRLDIVSGPDRFIVIQDGAPILRLDRQGTRVLIAAAGRAFR